MPRAKGGNVQSATKASKSFLCQAIKHGKWQCHEFQELSTLYQYHPFKHGATSKLQQNNSSLVAFSSNKTPISMSIKFSSRASWHHVMIGCSAKDSSNPSDHHMNAKPSWKLLINYQLESVKVASCIVAQNIMKSKAGKTPSKSKSRPRMPTDVDGLMVRSKMEFLRSSFHSHCFQKRSQCLLFLSSCCCL